jgi:hypothetical protein
MLRRKSSGNVGSTGRSFAITEMANRSFGPHSAERLSPVRSGLDLPLGRVREVEGRPHFGLGRFGVLLAQPGVLSLRSHDLSDERWRIRVDPAGFSPPFIRDDVFVCGPFGGEVQERAICSGKVLRAAPSEHTGLIVAAFEQSFVVQSPRDRTFSAFDWEGRRAWSIGPSLGQLVSTPDRVLITELIDERLRCVDARNGRTLWTFEAPTRRGDHASAIQAGFPGVAVVRDLVIVTVKDFRLFVLSLETGEVVSEGSPPLVGPFVVTDGFVYFMNELGVSEFDYRNMKEANRLDYRDAAVELYDNHQPSVCAFLITDRCVIWTTQHGAILGVSRESSEHGRRATWSDRLDAVMPIGVSPVSWEQYLYFPYTSLTARRSGLVCWRSADPGGSQRSLTGLSDERTGDRR